MNARLRQSVQNCIWPENLSSGHKVYALLDGARDARISYEIDSTFCEHDCLYAGSLPIELQRAAPYIVQVDSDDRLARWILDNGWGNSWGVFLRSDIGLRSLRKHLRTFLRVKDQRGNRLVFRYYDPRVLSVYLPTCTLSELQTVFGPIHSFVTEVQSGSQAIEWVLEHPAAPKLDKIVHELGKG